MNDIWGYKVGKAYLIERGGDAGEGNWAWFVNAALGSMKAALKLSKGDSDIQSAHDTLEKAAKGAAKDSKQDEPGGDGRGTNRKNDKVESVEYSDAWDILAEALEELVSAIHSLISESDIRRLAGLPLVTEKFNKKAKGAERKLARAKEIAKGIAKGVKTGKARDGSDLSDDEVEALKQVQGQADDAVKSRQSAVDLAKNPPERGEDSKKVVDALKKQLKQDRKFAKEMDPDEKKKFDSFVSKLEKKVKDFANVIDAKGSSIKNQQDFDVASNEIFLAKASLDKLRDTNIEKRSERKNLEKTAAAKADAESKGGDTGDFEDIDVGSVFLKFDSEVNSLEFSKLTKDLEKSLGDSGVKIKADPVERKFEITGINNVGDAKALSKAFNDNAEQIKATEPKKPLGANSKSLETLGAAGGLSQDVGKSFKVDIPASADKADDKKDDKADDKKDDKKDDKADDKDGDDKGADKDTDTGANGNKVPNKAFTKGALIQAADHLDKALSKGGMPDSVKSTIEDVKSTIEKMKGKD